MLPQRSERRHYVLGLSVRRLPSVRSCIFVQRKHGPTDSINNLYKHSTPLAKVKVGQRWDLCDCIQCDCIQCDCIQLTHMRQISLLVL